MTRNHPMLLTVLSVRDTKNAVLSNNLSQSSSLIQIEMLAIAATVL